MDKDQTINEAISRLSSLTGEDFHGYRSEIWRVVSDAIEKGNAVILSEVERLERERDEAQGRIAQLEEVLKRIIELPTALKSFEYLKKGIGTETKEGKTWLDAKQALATPSAASEVLRAAKEENNV